MSKITVLQYGIIFFAGMGTATIANSLFFQKSQRKSAAGFFLGMVLVATIAAYSYVLEPNWIEVTKVKIKDSDLARSLAGVKIVQLSDIHLTNGINFREKEMIKKVNGLDPDFIFLTGDYFDDMSQVGSIVALLKQLKARKGIWGVPGNTDHIAADHAETISQVLESAGVRVLVNQGVRLATGTGFFWLVGVDENVYHHDQLFSALYGVPRNEPRILLAHSPAIIDEAAREEINLVLSGHTHGGQVGIPVLIKLSEYANRTHYMKGLFTKGKTKLYVNRGIGMKTLPIRFLCRPEITLFEVVS